MLDKNGLFCRYCKSNSYSKSFTNETKSIPVVNRCVPDIKQLILMNNPNYASFLEGHIDQSAELAKLYIVQLYTKLPEIGLLSLASLLVTIILVFLLRYIANIVIYLIMLAASLGSISFSGFLWFRFYEVILFSGFVCY